VTAANELQDQVQEARRFLQEQRTLAFGVDLAALAPRAITAHVEAFLHAHP
jgi:hypothetical protein